MLKIKIYNVSTNSLQAHKMFYHSAEQTFSARGRFVRSPLPPPLPPPPPPLAYGPVLRCSEKMLRAEGSEDKRAGKKGRKRARKNSERITSSPKFGLCACAKLKYCRFLYLIVKKIYLFGNKSLFQYI